MATLLESVLLPTPISISSNLSAPVMTSSYTRNLKSLPRFNGLKMQFGSSKPSLAPAKLKNRRIAGSGASIVCEAQETAVGVPEVAEATWKAVVLESDLPVLVEFWAPWCGPCRMIHPVIDELAKEYLGKLRCFKLNTDESPVIATQYGIRSIPTVMIFKNGEKKDAVIGAVPKSTLTTSIEKFL